MPPAINAFEIPLAARARRQEAVESAAAARIPHHAYM